jgi:hypothetical protein
MLLEEEVVEPPEAVALGSISDVVRREVAICLARSLQERQATNARRIAERAAHSTLQERLPFEAPSEESGGLGPELVAIELAHRKKRQKLPEFESDKLRCESTVRSQVLALVPLLPVQVRNEMLGGDRGKIQVPDIVKQDALIARTLTARAGTEGSKLADARLALAKMRRYALVNLGMHGTEAQDAALFPMTATLAHELIFLEDERARAEAKGKKGGASVGPKFRDTLIFISDKLLWPIDVTRTALFAAAPKATVGGSADKAGTLPIAVKLHLETIARHGVPALPREANDVVRFYARTFLAANFDQSIRLGEGIRVELFPDEEDPDGVMRGIAWIGKDGAPMNLYAPAEGLLGPYEWYPEHLADTIERGQVYPKWTKPHNSKGSIAASGGLKSSVASKDEVRGAFKELLQMEPLAYTDEEMADWSLRGHSMHATFPDWARAIGKDPRYAMALTEPLAGGFSDEDIGALGLWLRDEGDKREATAQQAAMEAEGRDARKAAARASLRGRPAVRGTMRIYYGMAGTSANRFSERFIQLRVRQRLAHVMKQRIIACGGAHTFARGQKDITILQADMV